MHHMICIWFIWCDSLSLTSKISTNLHIECDRSKPTRIRCPSFLKFQIGAWSLIGSCKNEPGYPIRNRPCDITRSLNALQWLSRWLYRSDCLSHTVTHTVWGSYTMSHMIWLSLISGPSARPRTASPLSPDNQISKAVLYKLDQSYQLWDHLHHSWMHSPKNQKKIKIWPNLIIKLSVRSFKSERSI